MIVDDGSVDTTPQILAQLKEKGSTRISSDFARYCATRSKLFCEDERIRVIRNEKNEGIVGALNLSLERARGELIARMDADDIALNGQSLVRRDGLSQCVAVPCV